MIHSRGFTLIEMLIVVAIIAALAAIGYPLTQSVVGKSREATCLNRLRSIGVGLQTYLQEHGDKMPELVQGRATKTGELPVLETVLLPYVDSADAFQCPADHKQFEKSGSSYFWNATQSGLHVSQLKLFGIQGRPDRIPLIYDKEPWHPNKANFLYADMSSSNKFRPVVGK